MSTQKSVDRNLLSRARWASPVLPLLCALTLSACGTNGAASLDAASTPSSQATSAAPHSTAPSTPADEQKPSATTPQTTSPSPSQPTQTADSPTPTPANTAPDRSTLLNASLSLPSTCPATGPASFSGGQASLNFGGFARIEEPSATYTVNGTPTIAVALTCNGGGGPPPPPPPPPSPAAGEPPSYDLSKISDAESYEPVVTSLEPQGDTLHVEWSNERLPTDTRGIHSGSGTGSADLSWNGSSFDKSNVTVHDAQGNQVSS